MFGQITGSDPDLPAEARSLPGDQGAVPVRAFREAPTWALRSLYVGPLLPLRGWSDRQLDRMTEENSQPAHSTNTPENNTETCRRCGDHVPPDGQGEYRQRIVLEDFARSSGSRLKAKLCYNCWWDVFHDIDGGREDATPMNVCRRCGGSVSTIPGLQFERQLCNQCWGNDVDGGQEDVSP